MKRLVTQKSIFLLMAVVMLSSCVSKKKYDELTAAKEQSESALRDEIASRDAEINDLKSKSEKLQGDLNMSEQEVAKFAAQVKENNEKIEKLQGAIAEAFETYDQDAMAVGERNGKLYVSMANNILFQSGRAKLTKDSKDVVAKIADAINKNPGLSIQIEGHTDNEPVQIHKYRYKDNWALSTARALAILSELEKNGVSSSRLTAAGKGDTQPIASNETKEGREKNRRTEFIVEPKIDGLYRIYKENASAK